MRPKVITVIILLGVLGFTTFFLIQQQKLKFLMAENADLRSQLEMLGPLKDTSELLAQQLKAATRTSQSNQYEILRLRGQVSRMQQLEQDNTQLKTQRQQLEDRAQQAQLAAQSSPPGEVTAVSEATKLENRIAGAHATDLGTIELVDGTPTSFDLGGGTNCVITPTATADGNATLEIELWLTDANGAVSNLASSRLTTKASQHSSVSVGDRTIQLAVKLKPQ
jgi:TolA-binding protein